MIPGLGWVPAAGHDPELRVQRRFRGQIDEIDRIIECSVGLSVSEVRFANPPVRFVILTVFFEPLVDLKTTHIGSLFDIWKTAYPRVSETGPYEYFTLPGAADESDEEGSKRDADSWPMPFIQFTDELSDVGLGFQADRFFLRWAFGDDGSTYPGFIDLFAEMKLKYEQFQDRVLDVTGASPRPTAVECHYTNDLSTVPASAVEGTEELMLAEFGPFGTALRNRDINSFSLQFSCAATRGNPGSEMRVTADRFGELVRAGLTSNQIVGDRDAFEALQDAHDELIDMFMLVTTESMRSVWGQQ